VMGCQRSIQAPEGSFFLVVMAVADAHSPGMALDFGRQKLGGIGHFFPDE
jgi:hypothetical protein